jgi:hypothetical protein
MRHRLVAGRAELVEALVPGLRSRENITPIMANASFILADYK